MSHTFPELAILPVWKKIIGTVLGIKRTNKQESFSFWTMLLGDIQHYQVTQTRIWDITEFENVFTLDSRVYRCW